MGFAVLFNGRPRTCHMSRNTAAAWRIADTMGFNNTPSQARRLPSSHREAYRKRPVTPVRATGRETHQEWHRRCFKREDTSGIGAIAGNCNTVCPCEIHLTEKESLDDKKP
jgi:hypothetical protein